MRITGGEYRGRVLTDSKHLNARPATDRIRQAIFNILQNRIDLQSAQVLDLYAGTGSLGFEALSRGAAHVTFVDSSILAAELIRANAALLRCEKKCTMTIDDGLGFLVRSAQVFDLIFADPPYALEKTSEIPHAVVSRKLLKNEGFLIIEHSQQTDFPTSALYHLTVERHFGQTHVSFFSRTI